MTRWADNDPEAAARWVAVEPAGSAQIDHARPGMEYWVTQDTPDALRWVYALPVGNTRDAGMDMAAAQLATRDPTLALSVANAIGTPALRTARLGILGGGH